MKKPNKTPHRPLINSRKAERKQKRLQKRNKRLVHYTIKNNVTESPNKYVPGQFVRKPQEVDAEGVLSASIKKTKKGKKAPVLLHDQLKSERQKEINETNKLKSQMEDQRRKIFQQANEDEDKVIKKLEKQLGLNKSKNKNNYFADDGLDYLLEICDRATTEKIVAAEKHLANVEDASDFEDDLAVVTGKDKTRKKKDAENMSEISEESDIESGNESENLGFNEDTGEDNDLEGLDNVSEDDDDNDPSEEDDDASEIDDGDDASEIEDDDDVSEPPSKLLKMNNNERSPKLKTKQTNIKDKSVKQNSKSSSKNTSANEDTEFSEDEVSHLSNDDLDDDDVSDEGSEIGDNKNDKEKPDVWEDIYGRKRDKDGNIIKEEKGVYIPPHLRDKVSSSDKELEQLKRQIKSALNKLSGTNLHWASNTIEALYGSNSRHAVNSVLGDLWQAALLLHAAAPDRLVAEHAALVAALQANVAAEVGAHFLQTLTTRFDEMMRNPEPLEDKKLDNLVSCLAHLYSFKLYHASLLYDILGRLLEEITEKNIECVVVALRSVGGVLRKDDPQALRDFIHTAQEKLGSLANTAATGSRIKFLLEVLMAVKNNNLTKIPNYDPSYVEQLKKTLKTVVRKGNYITPLNIRLEDLLKADERGKWWVVGSAWEGNRVTQDEKTEKKPMPNVDQKLLELARKQRMNTDVRRSIFCVIMAAEDFMDAFEKLQHLGLKGQQDREIVHVLMACCLQEKVYNPYYALLAQKLCDFDRRYQLSIQFSVWDKIKDIDNQRKQGLTNLAQFLIHLIIEKGLPLSVLKVVEFSDLNKSTVKFMRQILLAIIMNTDLQASLEVFQRISKSPKLHMFRESLRLFIQHFLIRNAGKKTSVLSDQEMEALKERTIEVNRILTTHDSKLRF